MDLADDVGAERVRRGGDRGARLHVRLVENVASTPAPDSTTTSMLASASPRTPSGTSATGRARPGPLLRNASRMRA